jgi:hypothetical protein
MADKNSRIGKKYLCMPVVAGIPCFSCVGVSDIVGVLLLASLLWTVNTVANTTALLIHLQVFII